MVKHTKGDLIQLQSLPLKSKIVLTKKRIREWYDHYDGQVFVSFSGGKDSTVLLHIARQIDPQMEAVYVDTGLEYPEVKEFVKTFDNVTIIKPELNFNQVVQKYGYPVISKEVSKKIYEGRRATKNGLIDNSLTRQFNGNYVTKNGKTNMVKVAKYKPLYESDILISNMCCDVMKKLPSKHYEKKTGKKPIIGSLATESKARTQRWMHEGCNAFDNKRPHSNPMSFWTEQDVLQYIKQHNIPIASVYGDVVETDNGELDLTKCKRTGCVFCGFGCHLEKSPTRFEALKETHPKLYNYCLGGGGYNSDEMWTATNDGLGMKHVFDYLNELYGEDFIKY